MTDGLLRGSGLLAWYLLTGQLILGVAFAGRIGLTAWRRRRKLAAHRALSIAVLATLAMHLAVVVLGRHDGWGLRQVLLPWPGPIARNLGVLAVWTTVVTASSSVLVRRLVATRHRGRCWRPLHRLAYLALAAATAHAMLAGSDADSVFVLAPAFAMLSALALLAVERGIDWWTARRSGRLPDPAEVPWFLRAH